MNVGMPCDDNLFNIKYEGRRYLMPSWAIHNFVQYFLTLNWHDLPWPSATIHFSWAVLSSYESPLSAFSKSELPLSYFAGKTIFFPLTSNISSWPSAFPSFLNSIHAFIAPQAMCYAWLSLLSLSQSI